MTWVILLVAIANAPAPPRAHGSPAFVELEPTSPVAVPAWLAGGLLISDRPHARMRPAALVTPDEVGVGATVQARIDLP